MGVLEKNYPLTFLVKSENPCPWARLAHGHGPWAYAYCILNIALISFSLCSEKNSPLTFTFSQITSLLTFIMAKKPPFTTINASPWAVFWEKITPTRGAYLQGLPHTRRRRSFCPQWSYIKIQFNDEVFWNQWKSDDAWQKLGPTSQFQNDIKYF